MAMRLLSTVEERQANIPSYMRAIGQALDVVEARLRYIAECRCVSGVELTDISARGGGKWLDRAARLNGIGDVAPLLGEMCAAIGRGWDGVGILTADQETAEQSREAWERRYAAARDLALSYEVADAIDALDDVAFALPEWEPPKPSAPKAKRTEAHAA
jgi:hypothetical protein